jgi:hypothetical protein
MKPTVFFNLLIIKEKLNRLKNELFKKVLIKWLVTLLRHSNPQSYPQILWMENLKNKI